MYIKIYFENIPVYLGDKDDVILKSFHDENKILTLNDPSEEELNTFIYSLEGKGHFESAIILTSNFEKTKLSFFRQFKLVLAGGGLVKNKDGDLLMIFRRGMWDLPKGKLDDNELIQDCALREVEEETGLKGVEIETKLSVTYHTYIEKNQFILKETHWYAMLYNGIAKPIPQAEEQITAISWVPPNELHQYFERTYPIIQELIELSNNES